MPGELAILARRENALPIALGVKAVATAWDNDTAELSLGDGAQYVHVWCDEATHIIINDSTSNPSTDPAVYAKLQTHIINCAELAYLHYKRLDTDGNIYVTVFRANEEIS